MASIERTVYPRLKKRFTESELREFYTPTEAEIYFVKNHANGDEPQLHLLVLLKTFQHLGYFSNLENVPDELIVFLRSLLKCYDEALPLVSNRTLYKHQAAIRRHLEIKPFDRIARQQAARAVLKAAQTMDNPPDLINVAIEVLLKERRELPAFSTLELLVRRYRNFVNRRFFRRIYSRLETWEIEKLDNLLKPDSQTYRTPFNRLKDLPENPTLTHLQELLEQLEWLESLGNLTEKLADLPPLKIKHFAALAKTLDAAEMKDFTPVKRTAIIVCLIHRAKIKNRDALAEMFIKRMMKFHQTAKTNLEKKQIANRAETEKLLLAFIGILNVIKTGNSVVEIGSNLKKHFEKADLEQLIEECENAAATLTDNFFPLIWRSYRTHRSTLFRLLKSLSFVSTSQDQNLLEALEFLLKSENRRAEYLEPQIDIFSAPEKWQKVILKNIEGETFYERKHFEVYVFSNLMTELKSGDIAIAGSEEFGDYREGLLDWKDCESLLAEYCTAVELPTNAVNFVTNLKAELTQKAEEVDRNFARQNAFSFNEKGKLVIKKVSKQDTPAKIRALESAIQERMPERHLLDILAGVEVHTNLTRHFGPLSGSEAKLDQPHERYLLTIFTYGCNLGPAQAARHMRGVVTPHMLGFVNQRHITAQKLDNARKDVLNDYHRFSLPKFWGDGSHVSADGTKYELSDQNLMAEYHIRYGGYGGIAYYHVSDLYIALFSHFIACGMWEAVYIIDGLLRNDSEIKPDTIHADTQGQSAPVFGLAYLLGIKLQPRIRNIQDLTFYRPNKGKKYKKIDQLFGDPIDWELIETHWQDLMQVVLSIKSGKILPSTLLRKLNNYSRKNRLYQAYRELGRVIRTIFLLDYISDSEMRREIHAQTNKAEAFNYFVKWIYFGGEATIWENDPEDQEKAIKYNTLIADIIIFQNVIDQTRMIQSLLDEGYQITENELKALSPYLTKHIKRFGEYIIDLNISPPPLELEYNFSLEEKR